jgi:hypothetical protein
MNPLSIHSVHWLGRPEKGWLGFKFVYSNDAKGLMVHYASFMTKVHGDGHTRDFFNSNILDE